MRKKEKRKKGQGSGYGRRYGMIYKPILVLAKAPLRSVH